MCTSSWIIWCERDINVMMKEKRHNEQKKSENLHLKKIFSSLFFLLSLNFITYKSKLLFFFFILTEQNSKHRDATDTIGTWESYYTCRHGFTWFSWKAVRISRGKIYVKMKSVTANDIRNDILHHMIFLSIHILRYFLVEFRDFLPFLEHSVERFLLEY